MSQGDLNLDSFKKILELHPDLEHIELQGEGEPLLNRDFVGMLEMAHQRKLRISIITNGSLLTPKIIDAIFRFRVTSVHISLESAEPTLFQSIRGGKFDRVKNGLMLLAQERKQRKLKYPKIGLAVTVLKKTMDAMPPIFKIYQDLQLDAGIFIQPLQKMAAYTDVYDDDMKRELLSHDDLMQYHENLYAIDGMQKLLKGKKNVSAFYRGLAKSVRNEEKGCPWLLHGTFISYTGDVMPCCTVKDSRYSLGHIDQSTLATLNEARLQMNDQILVGQIPKACTGCGLANRVAGQSSSLVNRPSPQKNR